MQATFDILKSKYADDDEFFLAFNCAVESIESNLFGLDYEINALIPEINIKVAFLSYKELKSMIKCSFLDAKGQLYPEFRRVVAKEQAQKRYRVYRGLSPLPSAGDSLPLVE